MTAYCSIAYRWGHLNEHWYFVYAGTDKAEAVRLAEREPDYRGGKYGCAVYEFTPNGEDYTRIAYFPSMGNETEPDRNWRLDYFERLGHFADDWSDGMVLVPDPEKPGFMKYVQVEVPPILAAEVKRQEAWVEALEKAHAEAKNKRTQ